MNEEKSSVHDFWNSASCGEELYLPSADLAGFLAQAKARYELEPYITEFAQFSTAAGRRVLEIGVGLGADHQCFAEAGAELSGVDLTERAVAYTSTRLRSFGFTPDIIVGDAERLDYADNVFDIVYSWGVLHHSPNTQVAINEVFRVLKPEGGVARIMIYHKWSMIGLMLWIRYGLLKGRPLMNLKSLYSRYLESPGTKAYSIEEARSLFVGFNDVKIRTVLTHGDLLTSAAGQRHEGLLIRVARRIWPRWFIKKFLPGAGLFMLIEARK